MVESINVCVFIWTYILHVECCVLPLPSKKKRKKSKFGQICIAIRANPYMTYTLFTQFHQFLTAAQWNLKMSAFLPSTHCSSSSLWGWTAAAAVEEWLFYLFFFISTLSFFFTNANTGWQLQKKAVKLPNSFCDCEENSEHQVLLHKESKMWEQNLPHAHRLKYPKLYNVKIVSPKLKQPTSNTWATIIQ